MLSKHGEFTTGSDIKDFMTLAHEDNVIEYIEV
jgi:hypothetical protein